jgi:hypothetical protein
MSGVALTNPPRQPHPSRSRFAGLRLLSGIACVCALWFAPAGTRAAVPSGNASAAAKARVLRNYGKLPLRFEACPSEDSTSTSSCFFSRGSNYALHLTAQGADLNLHRANSATPQVLRMRLEGGNTAAVPQAENKLPGTSSYFVGNDPSRWRTGLPAYSRVRYASVYPGIDLAYYGNGQQLEYDFVVAPGSNPGNIRLSFPGAKPLCLDASGGLVIASADAAVAFHKPVVYQTIRGRRRYIPSQFTLASNNEAGFSIGSYDPSQPLVIDPTLAYSTLLGGSNSDKLAAIALDASGNAYLTGTTYSTDYPATPGAFNSTNTDGHGISFVTKLNASGSALVYSTFLGGSGGPSGGDSGAAIAVDSNGEAFVAGNTYSSDFPVTKGVLQSTNKATADSANTGFVTKINATGTALIYSTYIGGSISDAITSLAIDSAGDAYLAGYSFSKDYPTSAGAYQTTNNSAPDDGWNEVVSKLNPTATALIYSTYLGGSDEYSSPDNILVAIDKSGDAFVSGIALSTDYPVTKGAFQPKNAAKSGYSDMTLTKLNPTATALLYSTYLGGSGGGMYGGDIANGLVVDSSGNAYLAGTTFESNYPVTKGAYQTTNKAAGGTLSNAFLTKMNPTGTALVYSTYLGGSGYYIGDFGNALAIDSAGDAFVTGSTGSQDFPVTSNAYQSTNAAAFNDGSNAFLTEFNPTGTSLLYSTYMGGDNYDSGYAIAITTGGSVVITGEAGDSNFPVTKGAYETVYNSQFFETGFVAEFNFGSVPTTAPTTTTLTTNANPAVVGTQMIFTATVAPNTGTGIPTGNVVFNIDQANVATVALSASGTAIYTTAPLKLGQHAILASYSGSTKYSPSANNITEEIVPGAPTITPPAGTYPSAQLITLADGTTGTNIYYTLDGTTPTASSTHYIEPFLINASTPVAAIAILTNVPGSAVTYSNYNIVSAPSSLAVPATAITTAEAKVNALVNPRGMSGTYYFRYGTSATSLTSVTPTKSFTSGVLGSHASFVPIQLSAVLTGLKSKTQYFYQIVATTPAGESSGQILSFTTN